MFRNISRTIALQRFHISREVYQTPRVIVPFLSSNQTRSTSGSNDEQSIHQDEPYWRRVFHFPEMRYLAILSKLKFYPAATGVGLSSAILIAQAFGHYPQVSIFPTLYIGKKKARASGIRPLLLRIFP